MLAKYWINPMRGEHDQRVRIHKDTNLHTHTYIYIIFFFLSNHEMIESPVFDAETCYLAVALVGGWLIMSLTLFQGMYDGQLSYP